MTESEEDRLRAVENYVTGHEKEISAWWDEQRRLNENITRNIRLLFKRTENIPSGEDMQTLTKSVTENQKTQNEILILLERQKGRADIAKIICTFILTLLGGLALWALTK